MQTRYMERTKSMSRGKRSLEGGGGEDEQQERKRPALASVIVEALKVDSLQKLCSSLEPILRRVCPPHCHGTTSSCRSSHRPYGGISWSLFRCFLIYIPFEVTVDCHTRLSLSRLHFSNGDSGNKMTKTREELLHYIMQSLWKEEKAEQVEALVSEEVERALAKLGPARLTGRSSPKRIEGPDGRNLQLLFKSRLSLPLFTGGKVEGEQGAAIHVILIDANTSCVVTSGPESSVKLDIHVLEGDFNNEDDEGWSQEEFESHVVKEREGKRPLLTGDLQVTLKEGVGTLGELTFTDNSSWIRSRKFRLGLKVASGFCEGMRIREAKTEAFTVKDHRGELYKKHYPPALDDEVWRLEKIGKEGSFHKRLNSKEIFTVRDFLRLVVRDQQKLRTILGSGMSNKMWDALLEHAKTCVTSGKFYVYFSDDARNMGAVFNNIYELSGLINGEQYLSANSLSDSQKVYVDMLVKKAYDHWEQVIEYDGKAPLSFKQNDRPSASRNELNMGPIDYSTALDHQLQIPHLPVPSEQPPMDSGLRVGGYNDNLATRYSAQSHIGNSISRVQFDSTSFAQHDHLLSNSHQDQSERNDNTTVGLALGLPQSSTSGFETSNLTAQSSSLPPFDDWSQNQEKGVDEFFSEEEIHIRSREMLENEDMQHLLRLFSMGGHSSINMPEDGYSFSSYMPSPMPTFEEDRGRSGKAVVGWLKIKAAMRWGFFIRKKAAEKRAQIVELEDE